MERYGALARLSFDLSEAVQPFVELSFGKRESNNRQYSLGPTLEAIQRDNAFLPASVAAQINDIAPGVPGFALFNSDTNNYVRQRNDTSNKTWRGVVGVKGALTETWQWDAYYRAACTTSWRGRSMP